MLQLLEDLGWQYPKESSPRKKKFALYKCECGAEFKAVTHNVKAGRTQSCGCLQKRRVKETHVSVHGLSKSKAYSEWARLKDACYNPNSPRFKHFGAKGATFCNEWKTFLNFWVDMGEGYDNASVLTRIDQSGPFCKENCKWGVALSAGNSSGFKGVSYNKKAKKWRATISVAKQVKWLGDANTAKKAAKLYDAYIINNGLLRPINGVSL